MFKCLWFCFSKKVFVGSKALLIPGNTAMQYMLCSYQCMRVAYVCIDRIAYYLLYHIWETVLRLKVLSILRLTMRNVLRWSHCTFSVLFLCFTRGLRKTCVSIFLVPATWAATLRFSADHLAQDSYCREFASLARQTKNDIKRGLLISVSATWHIRQHFWVPNQIIQCQKALPNEW
jgi:hypothetical protein